jgi:hypothetical protein
MTIQAIPSTRMRLGDILLMRGLVTADGLETSLARQRREGGRIGESITALGLMSPRQLAAVLGETPATPLNVEQTGISRGSLLNLLLKFMRVESCETLPDLSARMMLPLIVLQELIDEATTQRLVHAIGSLQQGVVRYMRFALTEQGRVAAGDALAQSLYLGPAPVSLEDFKAQVGRQPISNERVNEETLRQGLGGMILPQAYVRKLMPALRAGRTILLYGPPGNGKTSIGTRIADLFRDVIYIPYAIEVNGQIIKMYDGRLHRPYTDDATRQVLSFGGGVQLDTFDLRWVACRRPFVMAGGELTLAMLDLKFDINTKTYDAPLHVKAMNGIFLIDDFGRQRVNPTELLNRWILPLESRIDYLTMDTGMSFLIPFDALVVFSTNLKPADLMDPAFLRRIPYKIEFSAPAEDDFRTIFAAAAARSGLSISGDVIEYIVQRLQSADYELAYFQPHFLCEQIRQICDCFAIAPEVTRALADEALGNLYVDLSARPTQARQGAGAPSH